MTVGIITAMSSEYEQIAALMKSSSAHTGRGFQYLSGEIQSNRVVLMQCGIGKVNSALGAAQMIESFGVDCIISSGVAGGIDESLRVMDVVVSSHCCYHDVWCGDGNERGQVQGLPLYFISSERLNHSALSIEPLEGSTLRGGLIVSGDQFITDKEQLAVIKSSHPEALAVDMESASIAQCCHIYNTPFVSIRIISDTPAQTDNHSEQYENFWGEIAARSFKNIERVLCSLPTTI